MIKNCFYYGLLLLMLINYGCEKTPVEVESEQITIYGREYPIGFAVLWENNPRMVFKQVPYTFVDTYVDDSGQTVTENVEGLTCLDDIEVLGNYMFSLYESSFNYIEDLNEVKGEGAVITIHLTSPEAELKEGEYKFSTLYSGNTFYAYTSTFFSSLESINVISAVTDGTLTIRKSGESFAIDYNLVNSNGGVVKGSYDGVVRKQKVPLQSEAISNDIRLGGIGSSVTVQRIVNGTSFGDIVGEDDKNSGMFSTTTGGASKLVDGAQEKVDLALFYDETANTLIFTSPLELRALTGRYYEYPNHTIYTMAPEGFTAEDYENITLDQIPSYFENITPAVFSVDNFKPGYVFFKSGQGLMGVMNVKSLALGKEVEYDVYAAFGMPGYYIQKWTLNPDLTIDVKSPGNFSSPQIQ